MSFISQSFLDKLSTGVDILGGLKSLFGIGGGMSQKDIMKWQEEMIARQITFQSEQARMNREFQSREAGIARDWNAVGAQLRRAQESGVNPNYLVSSGNYGSAGSSPSPSGSMASGSVSIPSAPPNQRAESFNLVAQGLAALSSSRLNDATADRTKKLLASELNKMIQEGNVSASVAKLNGILAEYLPREKQAQLKKIAKGTDLLVKQGHLTEQQINKVIEEYRQLAYGTNVKQIFDDDYWKSLKAMMLEKAGLENENILSDTNLKNQQAATEPSKRVLNMASAGEAATRSDLNVSNKRLTDLSYNIRQSTEIKERKANLAKFVNAAEQYGLLTEQMKAQIERLKTANKWQEVQIIVDQITALANASANIISSVR